MAAWQGTLSILVRLDEPITIEPYVLHRRNLLMRIFIVAVALAFLGGCATLPNRYAVPGSSTPLTFDEMATQIGDRQVVFVGEFHADRRSQRLVLEVIKSLRAAGRKVVLALELFSVSGQEGLNQWMRGGLGEAQFESFFRQRVRLPYWHYRNIFLYAKEEGIPLAAINAERSLIGAVAKNGIDRVPKDLLGRLGFVSCNEDPVYANFFEDVKSRGLHLSGMPYLCDGQRLRDAFMAYRVAGILQVNRPVVVVLVGALHATRNAVPRLLQQYQPSSYAVIMPRAISGAVPQVGRKRLADYLWY